MVPARSVVMQNTASAPLPPKVEKAHREQQTAGYLGEDMPEMLVELETEPSDREPQQRCQRHVTKPGKNRHADGFRPAPTTRPCDQHKRKPVRRDRRMKKCHGKAG